MYEWRNLTAQQRQELLKYRRFKHYPNHTTPHLSNAHQLFHISATCFEHRCYIGNSLHRIEKFTESLLHFCDEFCLDVYSWTVLPNHYHILVRLENLEYFVTQHGEFHGRTSYQWNGEDNSRGRQCFHGQADRYIRGLRHFWVTMNYVHNNPVHHTYVKKWQDWPFSSAASFIASVGREKAQEIWHQYPLKDYGQKWDAPEL